MRFYRVRCGKDFEELGFEIVDKDWVKIFARIAFAATFLVGGLAAYGAVEGDFTAYEKTLDTIVKLVELIRYDR
jgi:hypothetical protein